MKFKEFDAKMRVFEEADDHCILPGIHMVVRLDGRNFTRLTKEVWQLNRPFDIRFSNWMVAAAKHVMNCGFRTIYAYTQSDEISLLLHRDDVSFERKDRKLLSILASEATAEFNSYVMDGASYGTFDARISQLPSEQHVVDYFRWRQSDARRNARNAHVYWFLRDQHQLSPKRADKAAAGMSFDDKKQFLLDHGRDPDKFPPWQSRGLGVWWRKVQHAGVDPRTNETKHVWRTRLHVGDIPEGDEYGEFIADLLQPQERVELLT